MNPSIQKGRAVSCASLIAAADIAFIDTTLEDWQTLRAAMPPSMRVVLLDPFTDGLNAMVAATAGCHGVRAIHILGHGVEGAVQLGGLWLDQQGLDERADDLARLGACLAPDAELLLYGCRVAAGEGSRFLEALAKATGATVAASETLTGAAALGGDWDLGWASAAMRTPSLRVEAFQSVMAPPSLVSFQAYVGENWLELEFDSELDATSLPAIGRFVLDINASSVSIQSISIAGKVVTITLPGPHLPGDVLEINYADLTPGDDELGVLQTPSGQDINSFSQSTVVVVERPEELTAPSIDATGVTGTLAQGEDQPGVDLFSGVTASTNDAGQVFTSLTLTVTGLSGVDAENLNGLGLGIIPLVAGTYTQLGFAANLTATVTLTPDGNGGQTASVTINGLSHTDAQLASLLDNLHYHNATGGAVPGVVTPGVRVISITSVSDDGASQQTSALTGLSASVEVTGVAGDPTPPSLTLTPENSVHAPAFAAVEADLFDNVVAQTLDAGQTFSGMELSVHYSSGGEKLRIGGTEIDLLVGSGSFSAGAYAVTLNDGVYIVTLSGMSLSDAAMATLIDDMALLRPLGPVSSDITVLSDTRVVVLRSITDSGTTDNVTRVDQAASVTLGQLTAALSFITITPSNGTVELIPGVPTQLSFTVNVSSHLPLIGPIINFVPELPDSWAVSNLTFSNIPNGGMTGLVMAGGYPLTFEVTVPAGEVVGSAPIVVETIFDGFMMVQASVSSGVVMASVMPVAPELETATVNGDTLVLTFDMALDNTNAPVAGDFAVLVEGTPATISTVQVDSAAKTVTLTLSQPVAAGAVVSVSYTDPTVGDDAAAIQSVDGKDAGSFTGQVVTNETTGPSTPPSLTLVGNSSGVFAGSANTAIDLFANVVASTLDQGQTFSGLVLTVHGVGGNGASESLVINGTEIALNQGNSGSVGGGQYGVALNNGVATVTLSGLALNDGLMGTLIDGIGYRSTAGTSGVDLGSSVTRAIVLRSITDSGTTDNTTQLDAVATVTLSNTIGYMPFATLTPQDTTVQFTPGVTTTVTFEVDVTQATVLIGTMLSLVPRVPNGWTVSNVQLNGNPPSLSGLVAITDPAQPMLLTFDVTATGTDTSGSFPLSVDGVMQGLVSGNAIISGATMMTVGPAAPSEPVLDLNGTDTGVDHTVALANAGASLLDPNASISFAELEARNGGEGDWDGVVLSVQRVDANGDPDGVSSDVFSFMLNNSFAVTGGPVSQGSDAFGTLDVGNDSVAIWTYTSASGKLDITFMNAGQAPTTELVQTVLQSISYGNSTPLGDATLQFTFDPSSISNPPDVNPVVTAQVTVTSNVIHVTRTDNDTDGDAADGFSLAEALAIAKDGDTILLHDGVYTGQYVITKAVTIDALNGADGNVVLQAPDRDDLEASSQSGLRGTQRIPVLDVQQDDPSAGTVTIKNISIDGRNQGPLSTGHNNGDMDLIGIATYDSNVLIDNVHISNMATEVDGVTGNYSGYSENYGILAEGGPGVGAGKVTVEIRNSTIDSFQKTGIVAWGSNLEVDIHDNTIIAVGEHGVSNQNGMQIGSAGTRAGTTGSVYDNEILNIGASANSGNYAATGILLRQVGEGFTVTGNSVNRADGDTAASVGVSIYEVSNPVSVSGNEFNKVNIGISVESFPWGPANVNNAAHIIGDNDFSGTEVAISDSQVNANPDFNNLAANPLTITLNTAPTVSNGKGYLEFWLFGGDDSFTDTGAAPSHVHGGDGDDVIITGSGNDLLAGGAGNDTLTGGEGEDIFQFQVSGNGTDRITDFGYGDAIRVVGGSFDGGAVSPGEYANLAAYSVHVMNYGEDETFLFLDTNGEDGSAELTIILDGIYTVSDFALDGEFLYFTGVPPVPTLVSSEVKGNQLVLTYSELLDSVADAAASAFTITVNGVPREVTAVDADGSTVTLTLDGPVERYQKVVLDYTPPSTGSVTQSAGGIPAVALTGVEIHNNSSGDPYFHLLGTNPYNLVDVGTSARATFADIDGDGDLDGFYGNTSAGFTFYRNDGTATEANFVWAGSSAFAFGISPPQYSTPTFLDFDGDGDLDLLVGIAQGNTVVYRNDGSATDPSFTLVGQNVYGLSQVGGGYAKHTAADIDGDGDLDLLSGGNDGTLTYFRNDGTATTPNFTNVGVGQLGLGDVGYTSTPAFVDINNDGLLDVMVGNFEGNIVVYLNTGTATSPTFTEAGTNLYNLDDVGGAALPVFVDIDGDGDVDVLISNQDGNTVVYLQGPPPPAAPTDLALIASSDTGATHDGITSVSAPTLTGQAVPLATVEVFDGTTSLGTTTADVNGLWEMTLATLNDGSYTLTAKATSEYYTGTSQASESFELTIDTEEPAAPTVTSEAITNDTTPTLSGTAEAGSTVTVTVGGATYTTIALLGVWSVNLETATPSSGTLELDENGINGVSVTATDAAGNESEPGVQSLTIDTTEPAEPTITSDDQSNSSAPTLSGTAEAGSTVTVTVGGATYTTVATGGVWSVDLATATPVSGTLVLDENGSNAVSVTATDAAGNESDPATQSLAIDTTAPVQPVITSNAFTNDTTPILSGTAEAGSTVTVTVGGATYTTVATGGVWSVNLETATPSSGTLVLDESGSNAVSVTATDAAGNESDPGTQTLVIDTTAPAEPTITSDDLSNSSTPTLSGTAEAGSTVTVTVGGATYTTVATGGVWSVNLATATPSSGTLVLDENGSNAVSVTATDAAGNESDPAAQSLTIDTTAPVEPTITSDDLSNSSTPTLSGTAEAGSTVTVTVGGATYTTVATGGVWSVNLATATPSGGTLVLDENGSNAVSVTATDAAGNESDPAAQSLVIDTTAPVEPTITSVDLSNSTTPTLNGTAEVGSTVTVTVGGATYSTVATGGVWTVNLATATPTSGILVLDENGSNAVSVTATDAAGNESDPGTQSLVIDTTAPVEPAITSDELSNSSTPTLSGTAEAGSTVTVTVGGATYTTIATGGVWSVNLATAMPVNGALSLDANGSNAVSVTATDEAGNESDPAAQSLTIDTTVPVAPTITSAELTKDATPELSGTAEAGSTVTLTVGGATYSTTATGGVWSVNLETATPVSGVLALDENGNNAVSVTATDAAGNESDPGTQTLVIDTTAPLAPTITSTSLTNDTTPVISGFADPGSVSVTVTVGGATYVVPALLLGWTLDLGTATPVSGTLELVLNANNSVSATATDLAGNVSTAGTQSLWIDTLAPEVPTITSADLTKDATPELSGTAEAGSIVTVTVAGATYSTVAIGGVWSVNLETATPESGVLALDANGSNTVSVTAMDLAGNESDPGTQTLVIDTTVPVAPTLTSADLTKDATPELSGTAEAGSTVTVTVGGATYSTVATGGLWSVNLETATPVSGVLALDENGINAVSVTATDAAGNESDPGTQTLEIDTTAPVQPTILSLALTNDATPLLSGIAEIASTVTVTVGGATYTTIALGGLWSVNLETATPVSGVLALDANGSNAVTVTSTDAAGNDSQPGTQSLVIDTTAPLVPTVTSADLTKDATPELSGTAEADSTITLTVAGATYTTTATGGVWSVNLETATPVSGVLALDENGSNTVSVTATDAAGNVSDPGTQALVIDTTMPTAPTLTSADLTKDATPELSGTAEAGSTITLSVAGATYTTTATGGVWSVNLETATPVSGVLALDENGTNAVSVTATDAAGNESEPGTQTLEIDTTAPMQPTILSLALTNDATPLLSGIAEIASTVTVTVGGATYTTIALGGLWSVNLETATPVSGVLALDENGSNAVTVTSTDAAGNDSQPGTQSLVIDTTAPLVPTIASADLTKDATPELSGTAEADSTITLTVAGATYTTTATGGVWSVNLETATPVSGVLTLDVNGSNAVSVTATDAAGNSSNAGSQTLVVDTTLPGAPSLSFSLQGESWQGKVAGLEPGATWEYQIGTGAWVAGSGDTFLIPWQDYGANQIHVRQTDTAGNVGTSGSYGESLAGPAPTPGPGTDSDNDGLDDDVEAGVPGMVGGVQGDGNGDGIADVLQSDVTSLVWSQSPDGQTRYVTLTNEAGLTQQTVSTVVVDNSTVPAALSLPLGLLAFTVANVPDSGVVSFSVFIDGDIPVNGYWKQVDGEWFNIATAIVEVGGKTRIDFSIEDGGRFDADGVRNGVIVDPGAPGWYEGYDLLDTDNDQAPDWLEAALGLTVGVKDNDVFARDDLFVMQVYRDALGREAETGGLAFWEGLLESDALSHADVVRGVLASGEGDANVELVRLALGLDAGGSLEQDLALWRSGLADGETVEDLADAFVVQAYGNVSNVGFVESLYEDALGREADTQGLAYWLDQLAEGRSRGDVALEVLHSAEFEQAQGDALQVASLYVALLGREADTTGLGYWTGALEQGAGLDYVIVGIMGSSEYHDRFLPADEA